MAEGLRRSDLQAAAEVKLRDAILLFGNKRYSSAYYLAGYAAEMGLKACIAKRMAAHVIPERRFIQDIHTHDLSALHRLAGLQTELKEKQAADPEFAAYWGMAGQWTPESRYLSIDSASAQYMVQAIGHTPSGVLCWIKEHW